MTGEGKGAAPARAGGGRVGAEGRGETVVWTDVQSSGFLENCTNFQGAFSEATD